MSEKTHSQIAIIGNTYGYLHPGLPDLIDGVEAIFHVGDYGDERVLHQLGEVAPTFAVSGDADPPSDGYPTHRVVELSFGRIGLTHGHLYPTTLRQRIASIMNAFRDASPVIIAKGHSRKFMVGCVQGVMLVNPGAACPPIEGTPSCIAMLAYDPACDLVVCRPVYLDWPTELRLRESTGGSKYHYLRRKLDEAVDSTMDDPALVETKTNRRGSRA